MSSNCLVFHTSGGISSSPVTFLFSIFLSTESTSSRLNSPSFMSNCLLIILVICPCVTSVGFLVDFGNVVSTVLFVLDGLELSVYLGLCFSFC